MTGDLGYPLYLRVITCIAVEQDEHPGSVDTLSAMYAATLLLPLLFMGALLRIYWRKICSKDKSSRQRT
jgi:hypothetical protein